MSNRNRYRAEQRQRMIGGLGKLALFCGLLGTTAFYAYHVGAHVVQDEVAETTAKLQRERQEDSRAIADLAQTRTALAEARREAELYRGLYQQAQPNSDTAALMRLIQDKLDAAVPRERLVFFIQAAEGPVKCAELAAKSLKVRIGAKGGNEVRFGDAGSALTVTAEGTALQTAGKSDHTFDPAKPVTVRFARAGGKPTEITGVLPLTHTVLTRNYEQHLTIAPGAKGVLQVTGDRCDFQAG